MSNECWRTREIAKAEKERDVIRERVEIRTDEFREQDEKLKELIKERRLEVWQRKVTSMKGMWRVLCSPTNPRREHPARIITEGDKKYVTHLEKANGFARYYQSASSLKIAKEDRGMKGVTNGFLRKHQDDSEISKEFTKSEVAAAINSLNPSKAAGPDYIHPRLLHHIWSNALKALTDIYN
ncbi:Hypothetical predicted protein [Octopus vulgaris]|uniref:Uncharacterized protein n=1 Tax=Octopus vulgaris TaxID=6645 RepID=A0AA36ASJ4_OCTVU|nr:Hypothetical predicted protein [Octopus vulgaris]